MPRQQTSQQEETAGKVLKTLDTLKNSSERGNLMSTCKEIADRFWPSQSQLFSSLGENISEGEKRGDEVYDTTPTASLNKFASVLDSLLTPMDTVWHDIVPDVEALMKDRRTQLWLEELNRALIRKRYAPTTGFVAQNQLVYKGIGAYGNSALFVDEYHGRHGVLGYRYKNVHLSELMFLQNHQGIVETVYRYYKASAYEIMKQWGEENIPEGIASKAKSDPNYKYFLVHCVQPREDVDYARADYKGMDYASFYVSLDGKFLLSEGGYNEFPYGVSRYELVPGESYARSPAMDALAGVKVLNEEKKTFLIQGHRAIAPPMFAYDDGVLDTYSISPGKVTMGGVNGDGKMLIHPMPVGSVNFTKEMMDDERFAIKDAFLVPLFEMLEQNPRMTATEVMERVKEKGILVAPTVGRQYSEYHGRVIEREIGMELRQNPDLARRAPPMFLQAGGLFRLRYQSPLARMQRAEQAAGFMRTMETTINIATQTQNPSVMDHYNLDTIIPEINDIAGVPKSWMNGVDEIAAIRAGRAQQQQDQQDMQSAPGTAALVKAGAAVKKAGQPGG